MTATCPLFETRKSFSNGHFQTTGRVWCTPDPYAGRVYLTPGHRTRATGCSPTSDVTSASTVNHRTHITGLAHVTVCRSDVYTPASTTHRTHRARPVQSLMLRPMSPRTAFGECFSSHDFSKTSTNAIENIHFIFSKAPNPTC